MATRVPERADVADCDSRNVKNCEESGSVCKNQAKCGVRNRDALSPEGTHRRVITKSYGRSSGLFLGCASFPTPLSDVAAVSGCGAVSTENTAAGTVAESHGIPYFETITLQRYFISSKRQNKSATFFRKRVWVSKNVIIITLMTDWG